jgi:hypothetical protein
VKDEFMNNFIFKTAIKKTLVINLENLCILLRKSQHLKSLISIFLAFDALVVQSLIAPSMAPSRLNAVDSPIIHLAFVSHRNLASHFHTMPEKRPFKLPVHGILQILIGVSSPH